MTIHSKPKPQIPQALSLMVLLVCAALMPAAQAKKKDSPNARAEYLARVQQQQAPAPAETTTGSLWVPGGSLTDLSADYKARHVNDTIIIQVVQQTTATATGDTSTQRDNVASSSVTGLPGRVNTGGLNPLLGAQSSTQLKGQGSTSSTTKVQTSLAGQVIAVLPSGNLVVEAQREVQLNHQRETAIVRGVVRPGDVGPDNSVFSTSLANLEIELKGKGVVSDATRPPSLVMKILTRLLTF